MERAENLILQLLQAFCWFDEGLQNHLRARGWPEVTRAQSMVMANVVMGVCRPSDIARQLGISRQAVHVTINQMCAKGILALRDDPADGRSKIVVIARIGEPMRRDARQAVQRLSEELCRRIGAAEVRNLSAALSKDWGEPPDGRIAADPPSAPAAARKS